MLSIPALSWPYRHKVPKDPHATVDYQIDWSDWLSDGESIVSAVWTATGATAVSEILTPTTATVWVYGGTVGVNATLHCRITTDSSPIARIDDRTILLTIAER